ncbi:hypothetical protein F5876DRAFT_71849 [Lentinula aff. lateritia]|uniref:Uncharacterized protein n=1 Tax=Lentinula aff. lateritia TaxID=2804960 RepID=A0ACC1UGD4_9AGAR|nr:hypothetical protein F5876DRAFT_71849 [Lentinula aff. lateritia]
MPARGSFINQTYDETDTTVLHYTGGWPSPQDGWNVSNTGDGPILSSEDIRANVTFIFPTPANAVYYYGLPRCCGALYAICVDCLSSKAPIFETIDAVNVTAVGNSPPIVLWSKTFDRPGIHEILLTNQNDSRFGHSQITIDRFELQIPNTVTSSISGTLSAASSPSSVVTSSIPETPSKVSSTSPAGSFKTQSELPMGSIIGSVVGALVLIGFIIIMWVFRRRLQRRYRAPDDPRPPGSMPFITLVSSSPSLDSPPRHNPSPLPRRGTDPANFSDSETLPPGYDQISLALSNVGLSTQFPHTKH